MGIYANYPRSISLITVRALVARLGPNGVPEALMFQSIKERQKNYELPGGKVDKNDKSLTAALLRELEEEIGLRRIKVYAQAHVVIEPREPGSPDAVLKVLLRASLMGKDKPARSTNEAEDIGFYPLDPGHLAQMRTGPIRWMQDLASNHLMPGQHRAGIGKKLKLPSEADELEDIIQREIADYLKYYMPLGMRTYQGHTHPHQQLPGG